LAGPPAPAPVDPRPEYLIVIERLADPALRPAAIRRLEQLVDDAFLRARGNSWLPELRAITAAIAVPVISVYMDHATTLDAGARASLRRLLGWISDPRIEPAVKKALESFAARPHVNEEDAADLIWATRAAGKLELTSLREPMLRAFVRYSAGVGAPRWDPGDFSQAMIVLADRSWTPTLLALLEAPMPRFVPDDKVAQRPYSDQAFWQGTAAAVLGALREPAAAKPLIRMLLDPAKHGFQTTLQLALVKLGDPARALATELLSASETHELVVYAKRRKQEPGFDRAPDHRVVVARILGAIGRRDSLAPMLQAIKTTTGDTRLWMALELTKLPATPESKRAFRAVYEATLRERPPGLAGTMIALSAAAVRFADSETTDWLVARAATGHSRAMLWSASRLALPEQLAAIERAANGLDVDGLKVAKRELELCGRQIACHLYVMSTWYGSEFEDFGPKAAYTLAVLGDVRTRDAIVARLERITDSSVVSAAALAIDHLSPDGSVEAAEKIEAIIRRQRFDPNRIWLNPELDLLASRLRARAR